MTKSTTKTTTATQSNMDPSDSDPSLQLSEGSTLSSDSDIPNMKKKKKKQQKPKKKKKLKKKYCICRKGYDGKEFMIECDDCKEWFHGECIGLKPNSVTDHYFCNACTSKRKPKQIIILPPQQPQPTLPVISKLSINEEDDDDICVLCDGDCTCGDVEETNPPPSNPQPTQQPLPPQSLPKQPSPKEPLPQKSNPPILPKLQTKIIIPVPKKRIGKSISKSKKIKRQIQPDESSSSEEEIVVEKSIKPKKGKKLMTKLPLIKSSSDEDEEVIIDDLDDLLETMSPLSDHSSENSLSLENQEFFTDDDDEVNATTSSSVHIDSGDDEDIEDEETKQIMQDFRSSDDDDDEDDEASDDDDEEVEESDEEETDEEVHSYMYVEDNYESEDQDEEEIPYGYTNHWSSSEDDDFDEEIEFEYMTADSDEQLHNNTNNPFLPLLDSEGNMYDAAVFMNALESEDTPIAELSALELANALTVLTAEQQQQQQRGENSLRRPSLPSSALSAARRMRGSQDLNTSETLRALSSIDMSLSLQPIIEEEKEEKVEEEAVMKSKEERIDLSVLSSLMNLLKSSNQPVEKEPENSKLQQTNVPKSSLEQQIQDALSVANMNKRKAGGLLDDTNKRRKSRSNSLGTLQQHLQPLETSSFSTPASPAAIIDELEDIMTADRGQDEEATAVSMDDLVDTSQLYSRSLSPELEDDPYSKDLSRWQRIPIGAFRLMRSKNKLWLER